MKKLELLTVALAMLAIGSGAAMGQGRGGEHGSGQGGGPQAGGHAGGPQGGAYAGGGRQGGAYSGGARQGGASAGGGRQGGAYAGGWQGRGQPGHWQGGSWRGSYPYRGYAPYGNRYGYSGYYAYPSCYADLGYYATPGYYVDRGFAPYPASRNPGLTIYIERPPVVAAAPPPAPQPAPRADAPRLERYTLSAKELFAFDRAELRMPQPKLDEIATALVRHPQITGVTIVGYTDRLGSDSYNLKLSQRRADAVKGYLVGKGVAANRVTAIGRGEANPLVHCDQASRAALIDCLEPNRRVEVAPITIEGPAG